MSPSTSPRAGRRPGGAAYYAAVTAHRLGLRVGLLTSFGEDFPADALPGGIALARVPAPQTTVFRLAESGQGRTLTLTARADDLEIDDLPPGWDGAPLALLCPVINEVDPGLAESLGAASARRPAPGLDAPARKRRPHRPAALGRRPGGAGLGAAHGGQRGGRGRLPRGRGGVAAARAPGRADRRARRRRALRQRRALSRGRRTRPTRWTRPGRGTSSPRCS